MSQGALAKAAGMTRPTITRLESGEMSWTEFHLVTLAQVLHCQPTDLINIDPNNAGTIFEIYNAIPPAKRDQALAVLRTFVDKQK